jgi:hypothetical protein
MTTKEAKARAKAKRDDNKRGMIKPKGRIKRNERKHGRGSCFLLEKCHGFSGHTELDFALSASNSP